MSLSALLSIIATCLGVIATLYAFYSWLHSTERKRIESERQLSHALNNYASLGVAIVDLKEVLQEQTIELAQIKTLLNYSLNPGSENSKIRGVRRG